MRSAVLSQSTTRSSWSGGLLAGTRVARVWPDERLQVGMRCRSRRSAMGDRSIRVLKEQRLRRLPAIDASVPM